MSVGVSHETLNVTLHAFEPHGTGRGSRSDRRGGRPADLVPSVHAPACPSAAPPGKFDSCFVTRSSHVTGEIHSHDLAFSGPQIWLVNTLFSCMCTLHPNLSFLPQWKPPFISAVTAEDRCHLNGLVMADGRPQYATALGQTDTPEGWRPEKAHGGCLIDIPQNAIVASGFSMPHSPRIYRGTVYLLDSGTGRLMTVDPRSGTSDTIAELPGYTRGLTFADAYAFVGLCKIRETAVFGDVPIAARRDKLKCGVAVVELATGCVVALLEFTAGVHEIFAVEVLPGTSCPAISGPDVAKDNTQPIYTMPENWIASGPQPARPSQSTR